MVSRKTRVEENRIAWRLVVVAMLCAGAPAIASAQSVEILFTPGVVQQALALKSALKVDKIDAFGALALVGASPETTKAYAAKVAVHTAVIVVGEDALKAAAHVEFSVPVILVNANGPTAARSRIIRVFDSSSAAAPTGAKVVASPGVVADLIGSTKEVALKGDISLIVQALLLALK